MPEPRKGLLVFKLNRGNVEAFLANRKGFVVNANMFLLLKDPSRGLQNILRCSAGNSPVRAGDATNHGWKEVRLMDIPLGSSFIRLRSKELNIHIQFQIEKRSPGDYCFI